MATVAHGRTSSNNQRGTVGLSAGDWIRLKRLQAFSSARNYAATIANNTDVDIPTAPQTAYSVPFLKSKHTGASRIRRTNEQWINYRASQTGDYVQNTEVLTVVGYPRILYPLRICNCYPLSEESFFPKIAGGKCCIGKVSRYDGFIELGTDITVCGNSEKGFKLYTFTPQSTGTYYITANDLDSDPDLFISYPGGQLDTPYIAENDGGSPTELYSNTSGGTSQIVETFEAGQTYEVMVLQFSGSCFNLTVSD